MTRIGIFFIAIWMAATSLVQAQERGNVTNLPIPRYVSMKASEGNIRRGPSLTHRIDWVFQHRNMPLQITAEYENWRRVQDRDGVGGWIHYSLLSGVRFVIIETDMLPLYRTPSTDAQINANLELGVIAELEECTENWCELQINGYTGWAPKSAVWGVDADEVFE